LLYPEDDNDTGTDHEFRASFDHEGGAT
jgi:hypothetical protein